MTLRFNPVTLVRHNRFRLFGADRLPRFVFHLAHVALGLPGLALHRWAGMPYWLAAVLTLGLTITAKFTWVMWRGLRIPGLHAIPWRGHDPFDLVSDALLAQLGCALAVVWAHPPASAVLWFASFYVLETFNGT